MTMFKSASLLTIAIALASTLSSASAQAPARSAPPVVARSAPALPATTSPQPWPGVMTLDVDASDVARGVFSVRQTIPLPTTLSASGGPLVLRYPEWLPGNHAPRGTISDIAALRFTAGGRTLSWKRDPMNVFAFTLDVPAGVQEVEARFQLLTPTRTAEGRVLMTPAMLNLQWEKLSLYPAGPATRAIRVRPSITLPAGWSAAGALDGASVQGARVGYAETDYETLVDSPLFAGAHMRRWPLGNGVELAVVADEARFLAATDAHIAAHRALVDEAVALFGARHFDHYTFLLALTTELSGIGLEHHRSSENSRDVDYFTEWDKNGFDRGLLPHELVHSWNGKFRRPGHLWTPDYDQPMDDRLLWVYEGQTSFWDLVLGARSGMQPNDIVLGEWARYAAYYSSQAGRAWRSVEDTTLDPIMAARRQRPFPDATRTEDYYNESSLIWLEVEAIIRQQTGGRRGMDDFARAFFGMRDGDWGTLTYEFSDVVATLNGIAPYDWAGFFNARVMQPGQPAPVNGLTQLGYRLVFTDTPNAYDAARMRDNSSLDLAFSLGVGIDKDGMVTSVAWDGPMFRQGVTNGTKILAVGGLSYTADRLKAAITAGKDGKAPITLLVEKGGRYRTITPEWTGGLRFPALERIGTGPALLDQLLEPRRNR